MSNAKLDAIEKKYNEEISLLKSEYEKKCAQLNDINNDPSLEPPVQLESGYNTCVVVSVKHKHHHNKSNRGKKREQKKKKRALFAMRGFTHSKI